ncbi:MAG TPA: glycosyltransferase family 4 protein [Candidatus Thermoplasmatota archaeon]|nr:glycosyltransferase family 4 protein [Candidatus Thermoplasmatota archaeon]
MNVVMLRGTLADADARLSKERRALERAGHDVHVIDWDFSGAGSGPGIGVTRYARRVARGTWALAPALPGWWRFIRRALATRDWDVVHACDLDTLPAAVAAARRSEGLVVHDVFDYYPDMLAGQVPRVADLAMRAWYRRLLARVDGLVIADEARAFQVAPRTPDAVVMNTPEDLGPPGPPRRRDGPLRVFYAGALVRARGLFTLLDAVASRADVDLVLAGYGRDERAVEARASSLPNARFLGRIPYEEVLDQSRAADVLVAFYDPASPNNRLASPNKLYEAMMLGKPLVTNDGTLAAARVRHHDAGLVVPFGDAASLGAALDRLMRDPSRAGELGTNGRRAYEKAYAWSTMEARLVDLYARLEGA